MSSFFTDALHTMLPLAVIFTVIALIGGAAYGVAQDPGHTFRAARGEALRWGLMTVAVSVSLTMMLAIYTGLGSMPPH